ncbi:hypothetical protein BFW38_06310 [Terasakiispira papahanaumokuakeensis]|uniref:Uncharacterized protein n=1 Tax=Terasakiispira papahanaumokuakeensis TaxID=197479 RepID=A0A1E2V8G6_9GAMM|nr:hypothetical protein [Terasakiispira papahanaumokuakeensis]ODC03213.1 hypothetical protein BFW38_06310 [Terasakiispira papahanaumokuakeensis]
MGQAKNMSTEGKQLIDQLQHAQDTARELIQHGLMPSEIVVSAGSTVIELSQSRQNRRLGGVQVGQICGPSGRFTRFIATFGEVRVVWVQPWEQSV